MAPRFSVIIPVYNVKDYLSQCIYSVLDQTFQDMQIVIIDDVSNDGSLAIAREFAGKHPCIRLCEHTVNKGLGGARNTGIDAATGEFLLFLDSDDYLHPQTLEKLDAVISARKADIVEYCFQLVDEQGHDLSRTHCPETDVPLTRSVSACNKAIRAQLLQGIRFPEKQYYEDYCTIPKVLMAAQCVASLDEALYCYRQRTGSIIHDTNAEKNRDILKGTDALLTYHREKELSPQVMTGLEYLAVYHILYHAILRVNGIDRHSPLQRELKDYVQTHFPNHRQNPFRSLLSPKERRLLALIEEEKWDALHLRYHVRNRITGAIKRLLWKLKGK